MGYFAILGEIQTKSSERMEIYRLSGSDDRKLTQLTDVLTRLFQGLVQLMYSRLYVVLDIVQLVCRL